MTILKTLLLSFIVLFLGMALVPQLALAQTKEDICAGVAATGGSCTQKDTDPSVNTVIATVINVLSFVVGVVAVIMIIIGGLRYVTSNGDSNNTSAAKNTILYAIIGLVVVIFAQVIVRFVINKTVPPPPKSGGLINIRTTGNLII